MPVIDSQFMWAQLMGKMARAVLEPIVEGFRKRGSPLPLEPNLDGRIVHLEIRDDGKGHYGLWALLHLSPAALDMVFGGFVGGGGKSRRWLDATLEEIRVVLPGTGERLALWPYTSLSTRQAFEALASKVESTVCGRSRKVSTRVLLASWGGM